MRSCARRRQPRIRLLDVADDADDEHQAEARAGWPIPATHDARALGRGARDRSARQRCRVALRELGAIEDARATFTLAMAAAPETIGEALARRAQRLEPRDLANMAVGLGAWAAGDRQRSAWS